jgi:hypothetical protein
MSFNTAGLSLDQAPPLSIPATFFLTAPAAMLAAGVWLLIHAEAPLTSAWHPTTVVLTHLGTLGFLGAVMLGAMYQMVPVVAGAPVPGIRLAHGVHLLFVLGLAGLLIGLGGGPRQLIVPCGIGLTASLVLFLLPAAVAVIRGSVSSATVGGMALALLSLAGLVALGLTMAWGHGTGRFPGPRNWWVQVHLVVGLLGWVGMLIASVSWQVVPMFYLAPEPGRLVRRAVPALTLIGVALPAVLLLLGPAPATASRQLALAAVPAVLAIWLIHPVSTLLRIRGRSRRRPDASLWFWKLGLAVALVLGPLAMLAHLSRDPRWPILLVFLAAWGWAGAIVHGMLGRIISFLVWFHRFSHLVGKVPVPSMRKILPERHVKTSFWLHAASLVLGSAAILAGDGLLARATGLALAATAVSLAAAMVRALRMPAPAIDPPA